MAGLAGLQGLPCLLLQQAEDLADFGGIVVFICEALQTRRFARAAMVIESVQSLLPSTGLVFVFFNREPRFRQDESEPAVLKHSIFDWALCFRLCELYRFL